jgi:hypothetical protein
VVTAAREGLETKNVNRVLIWVQFAEVMERKDYGRDDVAAGRAFVASYVQYVHWVERLYEAAGSPAHGIAEAGHHE